MIEFIIVLILLSILATATYISWPGNTLNLEGQINQLADDLRYTQSLAITKGQRYRWVKTSANTYQITNNSGTAITMTQGNTTVTLKSGISFGTFVNLPNSLIAFDGKGTPYIDTGSPGTQLASTASIPITFGSETRTVTITPQTGKVTVQ